MDLGNLVRMDLAKDQQVITKASSKHNLYVLLNRIRAGSGLICLRGTKETMCIERVPRYMQTKCKRTEGSEEEGKEGRKMMGEGKK